MIQEHAIKAEFAGLRTELVRENRHILPGETSYFLSHERRFLNDLGTVADLYKDGHILELGAYPFFFTVILHELGFPVVGVDLHPSRALSLLRRHSLNVVACDIERQHLPFHDGCFDYVLFNELLEHLRIDPLFALSEANRVLRPGGILLLTTPNLYFIKTVLKFLLGRGFNDPIAEFSKLRSLGHMGHVREYSTREVRRFMHVNGFSVQRHELVQYNYPRNLFGALSAPLLSLVPLFRGYQVVVAKKTGICPGLVPLTTT